MPIRLSPVTSAYHPQYVGMVDLDAHFDVNHRVGFGFAQSLADFRGSSPMM
jgi:arginase family enzyme